MDTTLQVATTATGWVWHFTVDGRVTLCGRQVDVIKDSTNADCRNCEVKAGRRRHNRR